MRHRFTLSLQQLNPVVGDLAGNRRMAEAAVREAGAVDLVVFTELFITGNPPQDLVRQPAFVARAMAEVRALAAAFPDGPAIAVGTPWHEAGALTNAVAVLQGGAVSAVRHKVELSGDAAFDETRVFAAGPMPGPVDIAGVRIGFPIGRDIAVEDICECLAETGADLLVVPAASPYTRAAQDIRTHLAVARVVESELPLVFVNPVGGQDGLVFDGASFVLARDRALCVQLPAFRPAAETVTFSNAEGRWAPEKGTRATLATAEEADWSAAMMGLADHVTKNGFEGAVVDLTGSIDAAIGAALAVDALGADKVRCVMLADRHTTDDSLQATDIAARLGIRTATVPIAPAVAALASALAPLVQADRAPMSDVTIPARLRTAAVAAIAAAAGAMVVASASKSAIMLGEVRPVDDGDGAFNPIKDFYRTDAVRLCRWRNAHRPPGAQGPQGVVIAPDIIEAPRQGRADGEAPLPDETRDAILRRLVEDEASVAEVVAEGHPTAVVTALAHRLAVAEQRRRWAAPGLTISPLAIGRGRHLPLTNRYRDA